ncbi:MAG TPA: ATP-binding protein, partial [bacterium]|nr:ATP-binding protein [bacterium]
KRTRDLQREIAERKQAEEALRKSEQQYRSAIEVAGAVPYYQYYENHSFQFIGTGIQSLLGYSAEEFTMELWDDLEQEVVLLGGLVGLTLDEAVIKARNEEGVSWRADYRMRTRDGEERWIANAAVQVRDEKGNVIGSLGILQDLTERKQLEEHLRQSQKMEAVGQLAGGIAHDFNNLLTGILGNLNLAMRDAPDRILEYIQTAIDAANRAGHLVQQLLAFGRKSRVELKPVDLNRIVDEVYRLVRKVIDRRIDILVQTQEDLPTIEADAPQMNSVLMNLCINARDAINEVMYGDSCPTRQGDRFIIEIRTHSVFLSSEEAARYDSALPGPYAVLSVSDNGIGMSEQTQQHLFEPFFTTKDLGKGTGLGLAGTYGIVRQHNGRIRLESIPGKGTSISILLPAMESVFVDTEKEYQTELRGGKETILLVDDEEIIRDLGRTVL